MRRLGRQLMEPQRREQADHGTRMPTGNLRGRRMFGYLAARQRIESSANPFDSTLPDQAGEGNPRQSTRRQVHRAEQALISCQGKDGILRV